jgi:acyl-CoA synthetase (AMP-forming)/AMP-acid ligase II
MSSRTGMEEDATVSSVMAAQARTRPNAALLTAPETGRQLTFGALTDHAQAVGAFLQGRGIPAGATVALHLHNGLQTSALFLGLMSAGYVVAPLNLLSQSAQLAFVLDHSETQFVFGCAEHSAALHAALALLRNPPQSLIIDIDDERPLAAGDYASFRPRETRADDTALLMYTSGTTGTPKGVELSHANLLAGALAVAGWHGLTEADRVLSSLPLYHINGQVIGTLAPFVSGGGIIAPHRFSASRWWDIAASHGCTWLNMVPTIIAYLLAREETRSFPNIRFGRSASAPLPPDQHRAFERRFAIPVVEAMGMTECASIVFCNPHGPARRSGSPGMPCGVEARVVDARGEALGVGETGEIALRGPNVMKGYFRAPELTAQAIDADGWLRTGDLGFRDQDGYYSITGRLKELIIKGGENIAPREIDEALLRHPSVLEAAAFAVPDPAYGQEIAAAIIPKAGAVFDAAALEGWCRQELGAFKTPKLWRCVRELPKGPSGKVQRLQLASELGG